MALIVARWLGWSALNLAEAEALKLWDIVEIGLGGYVIGRSAEKVLPSLVGSLRKGLISPATTIPTPTAVKREMSRLRPTLPWATSS